MGQYYKAIVLKKQWKRASNPIKVYADSWDYDNGSKLMEHSYIGNYYCKAVEHMLANEFDGFKFVWCGDYADAIEGYADKNSNENEEMNAYCYADEPIEKINYGKETYGNEYHRYILNYDKKLFVELPHYVEGAFKVHPLPLLCADGNGRGGGDYHGTNMELVGTWAYNRIGVADDYPKGFKELKVEFVED